MKKKLNKVLILVTNSVLILVLLFCFWNIGVKAWSKIKLDKTINSILSNQDTLNVNYKDYIKTDGNIKASRIDYVNKILNVIPKNILTTYFNEGGVVVITDKDIATTYFGNTDLGRIAGLYNSSKKIVYISNNVSDIDGSLIHEFGHVLDSLTGWGSMQEEFKSIYAKEKDTFKVYSHDEHYKSNEREFFAEVFQESILNPKTCEASAKGAFDFVGDKIKSLKVD